MQIPLLLDDPVSWDSPRSILTLLHGGCSRLPVFEPKDNSRLGASTSKDSSITSNKIKSKKNENKSESFLFDDFYGIDEDTQELEQEEQDNRDIELIVSDISGTEDEQIECISNEIERMARQHKSEYVTQLVINESFFSIVALLLEYETFDFQVIIKKKARPDIYIPISEGLYRIIKLEKQQEFTGNMPETFCPLKIGAMGNYRFFMEETRSGYSHKVKNLFPFMSLFISIVEDQTEFENPILPQVVAKTIIKYAPLGFSELKRIKWARQILKKQK